MGMSEQQAITERERMKQIYCTRYPTHTVMSISIRGENCGVIHAKRNTENLFYVVSGDELIRCSSLGKANEIANAVVNANE